ncbi:hypothetical protein ACEZDB_32540 [Streptacidiphilus sp. N1-3]|uniref:XRE family transcriptional regulator n=1 Tax=Streptacidiphilus alkalitolerans TaxID=3342712 RepID=A0ABV6XAR3_9ACTN
MADTADHSNPKRPLTLAQKLTKLRTLKTPKGEKPMGFDRMARAITAETGISISGPYLWELCNGDSDDPKRSHLTALARYFKMPVSYFTDDGVFEDEGVGAQLALLGRLKAAGVEAISRRGAVSDEPADTGAMRDLLTRLLAVEAYGDPTVREASVRVGLLTADQRDALNEVLTEPEVLESLQHEPARRLVQAARGLSAPSLESMAAVVRDLPLVDALADEGIRSVVKELAGLSPASIQAIAMMSQQLRNVERIPQQ